MLDRNTLATRLQAVADRLFPGRLDAFQFYLFGSSLYSESPRDLDILVKYDNSSISHAEAIALRKEIHAEWCHEIDVCLLTGTEAVNNPFLEQERCERLRP